MRSPEITCVRVSAGINASPGISARIVESKTFACAKRKRPTTVMNNDTNTQKPVFVDYRQALRLICESEINGVAKKDSALHRSLQWGYTKSPIKVSEGDLSFVWDMDGVKTLIGIKPLKNGGVRFHTQEVEVKSTITPVTKG